MESLKDIFKTYIFNDDNNSELSSERVRFLHYLLYKYNDQKSFWFWYKVVSTVDLDILKAIDRNITEMEKNGYPFKNKTGYFVNTLKILGLLKSKKRNRDEGLEKLRRQKNYEQERLETERKKQEARKKLEEWLRSIGEKYI